jgi:hypothetical protein
MRESGFDHYCYHPGTEITNQTIDVGWRDGPNGCSSTARLVG